MKICYVGNANSIHTQRWAAEFARRGDEVHLVSPWLSDVPSARRLKSAGVSLHILESSQLVSSGATSGSSTRGSVRLVRSLATRAYRRLPDGGKPFVDFCVVYNLRLRSILRRIQPDLVHGWFVANTGLLAAVSGFRPLVTSPWGADVLLDIPSMQTLFCRFARRYALASADAITATCAHLARATERYAPRSTEIRIIPFGVDCERFRPDTRAMGPGNRRVVLGFAKRLAPKYGPEYLVRAFGALSGSYPHLRLMVAGHGPMASELRALCRRHGIQDRVSFWGHIDHEHMPEFLSQCDVFVMPSVLHSEVFGVAALEASAMEIPVVASRVGGVGEVVRHGETGLLVEPRDEGALADAIAKLVEDGALRRQMGQNGREHVLSAYRWQDNAAEMGRVYQQLVETQP